MISAPAASSSSPRLGLEWLRWALPQHSNLRRPDARASIKVKPKLPSTRPNDAIDIAFLSQRAIRCKEQNKKRGKKNCKRKHRDFPCSPSLKSEAQTMGRHYANRNTNKQTEIIIGWKNLTAMSATVLYSICRGNLS